MVAIKDMKMPTDCMECMFCNHIKSNDYGTYGDCVILGDKEQIDLLLHQKHSDCPLVKIEERKVGKWIFHEKSISTAFKELRECSCCHCYFRWEMPRNSYCPNCGAEMTKE